MCKDFQNTEVEITPIDTPKRCCLNCGTELNGEYCHICGQHDSSSKLSIKSFISDYLDNAFLWDSQFLKTIWLMISRPGFLTKEFLAGKFVSQENPLKLNMFLLFVFITLCIFFKTTDKLSNTMHNITADDRVISAMHINSFLDDDSHLAATLNSSRDTVLLQAPLSLAETHPDYFKVVEIIEDASGASKDRWVAIVPHTFIDEGVFVQNSDDYYCISDAPENLLDILRLMSDVGVKMLEITMEYLPIILLLTAPLLSFSLHLVWRKQKLPNINHLIFSLHYTAFVVLLIIFIYLLYLIFSPPNELLEPLFTVASCVYLTIAFREVYATTSWLKTIIKAFITSMIYFSILAFIFVCIFIAACFVIANQMA